MRNLYRFFKVQLPVGGWESSVTNNNQPKEEGYFKGFNGYEWGTQLKVLQGEAQSAVQIGVGLLESFNAKTLLVTNITIIKI